METHIPLSFSEFKALIQSHSKQHLIIALKKSKAKQSAL